MGIISLYEKSENLFFVGGIVRDELLGKISPDIDCTYVGNAIEFAKSTDFEITQINEEFGSVHLKIDGNTVDITSTRSEVYPKKGQLPVVEKIGCSLKEDVIRRDFTVNAIAKNCKTGEILDYAGGIEDLKNKKLRVLHDLSFVDDPTRIIRGLKFAVRFDFELDEHTKKLQEDYLENVNYEMSFKRLKDELKDAFNLNKQDVLNRFNNQKMYKLLSKNAVENNFEVETFVKPYISEVKNLWLVYLGGFDLTNIPLTKQEQKILDDYKKLENLDLKSDFEIYKAFESLSVESILLYGIHKNKLQAQKYLENLRHIKITVNGNDIKQMGYEPSIKFSKCLDAVLCAKLETPTLNHSQELDIIKSFM